MNLADIAELYVKGQKLETDIEKLHLIASKVIDKKEYQIKFITDKKKKKQEEELPMFLTLTRYGSSKEDNKETENFDLSDTEMLNVIDLLISLKKQQQKDIFNQIQELR